MKLEYFTGKNFGDALNPYIFQHFLPDFFNDDPQQTFFGIGSILGFGLAKDVKQKIIFSSGYAYGDIPEIDSSYDFICVRGPLTAKTLGLPEDTAVADGAILLQYMDIPKPEKQYKFSFMPHWGSEQKYSKWPEVCAAAGIHYISPMQDKDFVLQEILKSEVIIAEAMHAAIVADTLGVPWIPVKAYPTINEFKWNDWASSLNLKFEFSNLSSLYENNEFMFEKLKERTNSAIPKSLIKGSLSILEKVYFNPKAKQIAKQLKKVKLQKPHLSDRKVLSDKGSELLRRLEIVKNKYS